MTSQFQFITKALRTKFKFGLICQNKSLVFQIQPNKKSDSIYYIGRFSTWYSDHKTKKEGRANKSVWYLHTWNLPGTNSHFLQLKSLTANLGFSSNHFDDETIGCKERKHLPTLKKEEKNHFRLQIQGDIFRSTLIPLKFIV